MSGVVTLAGVISSLVIGLLWLLVNRTRAGNAVLAASMNPRGVMLLGIELGSIYLAVWIVYGLLVGTAGVLLCMFLGCALTGPVGRPSGRPGAYDVAY